MPPQAFQHLWDTVGWAPLARHRQNRAKNGDHCWVDAFVVPVRHDDQTVGYMSVRSEPSRAQIQAAEALYAQLNQTKAKLDAKGSWLKRISLRARLEAVMAFMAAMLVGGAGVGLVGIYLTNQDLQEAYQDHLTPSLAIAKMIERLGDNRAQVMLGLQHNPDGPSAKMHDHPVDLHIEAALKNRSKSSACAPSTTNDRRMPTRKPRQGLLRGTRPIVRGGNSPAREALKAGDFTKANVLLLTKINPLYKELLAKGDALQQHIFLSGEKDFHASQERYQLIRNLGLIGTLLALLLVAVAGAFLIHAIIDPIRRAISHFDRISQSNLTDEIDISGHDEAGHLMHSLATMQVHLKVMMDEVRLASSTIDNQCRRLTDEMNHVVEQSREQRPRPEAWRRRPRIHPVGRRSRRQRRSCRHRSRPFAFARRRQHDQHVEQHGRHVARRRAVQASSTSIGDLNHAIQKIGDITNTIKEIADQTNLLALNAAIEAARAGEQGPPGFAVVADEVRKLAERTSASTSDITATVAEFRAVTHNAVGSMGQAVQEVEQGIGMMRTSVGGLDQIKSSSDDVANMSEHIAAAARQQAVASEEVAANMEKISTLIDQNTSMALDAYQTVDDLSKTAAGLMSMVEHFKLVKRN
jgi:aerotaxis receptor